ncbi:cyclic nucleotide gated channel beta 1 [Mytilus galloprovincialis]|uniref:Cyclic nucleotide gated channel beta 1 n=1 Tax=Mytilus galloprovincialis TaxID=29158 RepID=A0A8B6E9J9_MYTGA|nr:cyclic nucleotide gated channel beta 1 [Mytilus galloprovincialis]
MGDSEDIIPPRIEVSHFAVSKVSTISEESLIGGNEELPGGVSNPVFKVEEPSEVTTPEPEHFTFDTESIQRFKTQPRRGTYAGGINPAHRLLITERRSSENVGPLQNDYIIPNIHTNHGIQFTSDDLGQKQSNDWDSFPSEGRLPAPPTPGLLSINGYDRHGHPPPSPGLLSINSVWSELGKISSRRSSYTESNESSFRSGSLSNLSSSLSEHLHNLVRAFSSRTERVKASTVIPPSPSDTPEYDANSDALSAISNFEEPPQRTHRIDSFIPGHKPTPTGEPEEEHHLFRCCRSTRFTCKLPKVFEAQSKIYMGWLFLVTCTFMYNAYSIPLRASFQTRYMDDKNKLYWLLADYTADVIYLLDILVFKPRLTYLVSGLNEIQTFWEFYQRCDQAVRSAHILRILKTMTYMVFLIHIETCGYYSVSLYEGFDKNDWVYNGKGNAYIRCFYLATKTATSIGKINKPQNELEYVFMTVYWLSGVFVFALLVGQIRDIVESAQRVKTMYDKRMETALRYVKNLNLPKEMREKVRVWFLYNWQQQKVLDEKALMDTLPTKLRTDLAIHVHFNTLSKVKLFQDCDKSLLFNLVLKLKPMLYLPGEYVCRKGEVGKEMYIVSQGLVEVVGGLDNSMVFATLKNGSVFGEISLLSVGTEGNRRTADVRVKGFTNLFMLSKADFESAMSEFPAAHTMLKKRARKLLRQNAKMTKKESESSLCGSKVDVEEIIHQPKERKKTPKLLQTVMQVMNPAAQVIKKLGSSSEEIQGPQGEITNSEHVNSNEITKSDDNSYSDNNNILNVDVNINSDDNQMVEVKKNSLQEDSVSKKEESKSLTTQEVEDFYDEILRATEGNPKTFDEAVLGNKNPLNRDGTAHTDDSVDSGVHVTKAASPTSSDKTISKKASKESFFTVSTEDTDNQKGKVGLLAEFFEDDIHNDLTNNGNETKYEMDNCAAEKQIHKEAHKIVVKPVKNESVKKQGSVVMNRKPWNSPVKKITFADTASNVLNLKTTKDSKHNSPKKVEKSDKQTGLLIKPGSKKPTLMGMKSGRKITPEIRIDSDHITKPHVKKKTEKNSPSKSITLKNSSILSHKPLNDATKNTEEKDSGFGTKCDDTSENKSDSIADTDSQLEKNIFDILDSDEKADGDKYERTESRNKKQSFEKENNNHEIKKQNEIEQKTYLNQNYKHRISKIETSISSLSSEIEKADALLRDLCSDDDDDLIQYERKDELSQSQGNTKPQGKINVVEAKEPDTVAFTIPAKNQITCSVEVHREKSLTPLDIRGDIITPISLTEWIENANESLRKRKESSTSSIFHETGV